MFDGDRRGKLELSSKPMRVHCVLSLFCAPNRSNSLQVLGASLLYPPRQRFHDDEPAGRFKRGIGVRADHLLRGYLDPFRNSPSRRRHPSTTRPAALKELAWLWPFDARDARCLGRADERGR